MKSSVFQDKNCTVSHYVVVLLMKLFQQAMDVHVLETDVFKFNYLNVYIAEIMVYFSLKLASVSNK